MIDLDEFRGYLKVDKLSLDDELVQQPSLLFSVSEACAEAAAARDMYKELLATADAELFEKVRDDLDQADEKYTDTRIKGLVQTNKKHRAAFDFFSKAKAKAEMLEALKNAFIQRGYAIRNLCELFVANYYEQNSVRGTDKTDTAVYMKNRERLAEGRTQHTRARIKDEE